LIVTDGLSFEL
jgi:hypothetical protein